MAPKGCDQAQFQQAHAAQQKQQAKPAATGQALANRAQPIATVARMPKPPQMA